MQGPVETILTQRGRIPNNLCDSSYRVAGLLLIGQIRALIKNTTPSCRYGTTLDISGVGAGLSDMSATIPSETRQQLQGKGGNKQHEW